MDLLLCKGTIPLITFAPNDSFGSQLNVQAFSHGKLETSYDAISHVWSDRLGNLRETALPACQLQRLQSEVNALYPAHRADVPFWIDTIYVPREKTKRALAIKHMRDVYEKAMPLAISKAGTREVDIDTNENSPDSVSEEVYEEASEEDENLGASQDGRDLKVIEASIEASKAKTQAIYAEIARLKTETAEAYEQAKQIRASENELFGRSST